MVAFLGDGLETGTILLFLKLHQNHLFHSSLYLFSFPYVPFLIWLYSGSVFLLLLSIVTIIQALGGEKCDYPSFYCYLVSEILCLPLLHGKEKHLVRGHVSTCVRVGENGIVDDFCKMVLWLLICSYHINGQKKLENEVWTSSAVPG